MNTQARSAQGSKKTRTPKSEAMTPKERKAFEKWVSDQPTKIDAAEKLEVSRGALDDLLHRGTGKPENIAKIKVIISQAA